jgi:hypothetical protein
MAALNPLPSNTTLVTMDVTSLYTNIPHSDGIEACKEIWESRSVKIRLTDCLVTMITMVLKRNNFTFNGDHYLQINGTAMGTKMAPSYANIFMGKFEKQLLESSIERPLSWYRFIDDVDMKWTQMKNYRSFFHVPITYRQWTKVLARFQFTLYISYKTTVFQNIILKSIHVRLLYGMLVVT